jgi:hypothetical protein
MCLLFLNFKRITPILLFTECEIKVSSENTVGLFSVIDPLFGLCKNALPVEDFTECLGKCETKTRYIGKFMY